MATKSSVATLLVVVCLVVAMAVTEAGHAEDQKCYDDCYKTCGWPTFVCKIGCFDMCFLHLPGFENKGPGRKEKGGVGTEIRHPAAPSMEQPNPKLH
ncbi:PE family protein [Sesbania bispinosa]|nr:PE family protein [Sesbania bispinosa]